MADVAAKRAVCERVAPMLTTAVRRRFLLTAFSGPGGGRAARLAPPMVTSGAVLLLGGSGAAVETETTTRAEETDSDAECSGVRGLVPGSDRLPYDGDELQKLRRVLLARLLGATPTTTTGDGRRERALARVVAGCRRVGSWLWAAVRLVRHAVVFVPLTVCYPLARLAGGRLWELWQRWFVVAVGGSGVCASSLAAAWLAGRADSERLADGLQQAWRHSWTATTKALGNNLRRTDGLCTSSVDDHFAELDSQPVACTPVAQLYAARLYSGEAVLVKVRHPDVEGDFAADAALLRTAARLLHYVPCLRRHALPDRVASFVDTVRQQIDLRLEAVNLLALNAHFSAFLATADRPTSSGRHFLAAASASRSRCLFPLPVGTATADVLITTARPSGAPIASYFASGSEPALGTPALRSQLAFLSASAFFHSLLVGDAPVCLDFRPERLLVIDDSDAPRLCITDADTAAWPTPDERQQLRCLLAALAANDGPRCAELIAAMSAAAATPAFARALAASLAADKQPRLLSALSTALAASQRHAVAVAPCLYQLQAALTSLQHLSDRLAADPAVIDQVAHLVLNTNASMLKTKLPVCLARAAQRFPH